MPTLLWRFGVAVVDDGNGDGVGDVSVDEVSDEDSRRSARGGKLELLAATKENN